VLADASGPERAGGLVEGVEAASVIYFAPRADQVIVYVVLVGPAVLKRLRQEHPACLVEADRSRVASTGESSINLVGRKYAVESAHLPSLFECRHFLTNHVRDQITEPERLAVSRLDWGRDREIGEQGRATADGLGLDNHNRTG
jgi:hypothetical protein